MKTMMLEVITTRKILLQFQKDAFTQVASAQKQQDFNHLKFNIMNWAFWLRADLELLIRAAYWQNLSETDITARILYDSKDLYEVTCKKMEIKIDNEKVKKLFGELQEIEKKSKITPIKPEKNDDIIEKLSYRKDELKDLFGFYKALSKFSHPDPVFLFFPEEKSNQIRINLMNIFSRCRDLLDKEWILLEAHLRKGKE